MPMWLDITNIVQNQAHAAVGCLRFFVVGKPMPVGHLDGMSLHAEY